jgi:type VI protein secretion system component VasF
VKDERFDLEGELHAGRSEPRSEFVTSLAGDVRGRVRRVRVGLWMALAGLVVVAVASFGGIGTAATTKQNTAASAQYTTYKPKTAKFTPKTVQKAQPKQAAKAVAKTAAKPTSQLPFTGLALWVPLAIGLMLIVFGVTLRTRAKRHGSSAH